MGYKILVTGGAGYIGSVLTRFLLDQGFSVTVLDSFIYKQNSLMDCCMDDRFSVVRGDCRDKRTLGQLVKKNDILIPLAALVGAPVCKQDPVGALSTNLEAIQLLCDLASTSQWILFPVTNSGYGIGEKDKFCNEETPLRPISLYGDTKVRAEEIILNRINSITFRLATVFGSSPRMRLDLLVNDFVHRAIRDKAVVLFEGHFKRNFIHVRDVAKVFLHGISHFDDMKGKPYNVGLENANLSKVELCQVIKKNIPGFVFMEASIGEDVDKRDYIVSNSRIMGTGYSPDWSIERGIHELIKCYTILQANVFTNV